MAYDRRVATSSRAREQLSALTIVAILVAAVLVVRQFADPIRTFIDRHAFWGLFLYITLNILDAVLAPSAFLLAYLGKLPNAYEISAVGAALILVAVSILTARRKDRTARHG